MRLVSMSSGMTVSCFVLFALSTTLGCTKVLGLDGLVADLDGGGASSPTGTGSPSATGTGDTSSSGNGGMIAVTGASASYSIDAFEVTVGEYRAFLAAGVSTDGQEPGRCDWNTSYVPGVVEQAAVDYAASQGLPYDPSKCDGYLDNLTPLDDEKAVSCIDWCDAAAYCKFAGKRLCGKIGGGTIDITNHNSKPDDDQESEWFRACSGGTGLIYPYGPEHVDGLCNDGSDGNEHVVEVDANEGCNGGFDGLRNMSGNVAEWENACSNYGGTPGVGQNCTRRGGAFFQSGELACALPDPNLDGTTLSLPADITGIRCCR